MNKKAQINLGYREEPTTSIGFIAVLILFLILTGVFIFCSIVSIPIEDSRGQHTGFITAVETNGIIFKTDRAYVKSDVSSSQEDMYCIIDDTVKQQLEQASINKDKVTVYFYDWIFRGWNNCKEVETAIIYKIEVTK
jgi:hypothetical protein